MDGRAEEEEEEEDEDDEEDEEDEDIHVMSLDSPGTLAKARRLQLADASFHEKMIKRV